MDQTLALEEFVGHLLIGVELYIRDRLHVLHVFAVQGKLELVLDDIVLLLLLRDLLVLLDHLVQAFQLQLNILLACGSPLLGFPALLQVLAHAE